MSDLYKPLSDYEPKEVHWLWPYLIAYGMINIIEGDPDTGKSYLVMHLAAKLSAGGRLPDGTRLDRQSVIYCTAEDDCSYTFRPRSDSMGGDADRIFVQAEYDPLDEKGLLRLRRSCEKQKPGMIVLDTLYGFVPGKANVYSPNEIRQWLAGLNGLAQEFGIAVVIIRHLTKMKHGKAIYQGSGTMDVLGVVRSALLVMKHPEQEDVRVMAHLKHNLAPRQKSWEYKIVEKEGCDRPVVEWLGQSKLSAQDLSDASGSKGPSELDRAIDFLQTQLSDGPKRSKIVEIKARKQQISKRTLNRAKELLGVQSKRKGNGWVMSLPKK